MNYVFKDLAGLAEWFACCAAQSQRELTALGPLRRSNSRADSLIGAIRANLDAARTIRQTVLSNPPIAEEYAVAYAEAQGAAATQVWTSMRLHDGDPRWIFISPDTGYRGEALT